MIINFDVSFANVDHENSTNLEESTTQIKRKNWSVSFLQLILGKS